MAMDAETKRKRRIEREHEKMKANQRGLEMEKM